MVDLIKTEFGFKYGSAEVTRIASDPQRGCVVIEIKSPKKWIQVYVTKTGKMRAFTNGKKKIDLSL